MAEYINRERARFEFERFLRQKKKTQNDCDSLLCMLPSADVVEVVHGHWLGIELKDTCSVCNRSISEICDADSYIEIEVLSELIACPFCGAKMDGDKNG